MRFDMIEIPSRPAGHIERLRISKAEPISKIPSGIYIDLFQFPLVDLHGLFVELQVALVAALADVAIGQGRGDGAAGFFSVGAVPELALA